MNQPQRNRKPCRLSLSKTTERLENCSVCGDFGGV
jgi:hypothetical protein